MYPRREALSLYSIGSTWSSLDERSDREAITRSFLPHPLVGDYGGVVESARSCTGDASRLVIIDLALRRVPAARSRPPPPPQIPRRKGNPSPSGDDAARGSNAPGKRLLF